MKAYSLFLLFAGTLLSSANDLESTLIFADRTRISGQTLSVDSKEKNIQFQASSLKGQAQLLTKDLLEMTLSGQAKVIEADHYALATIKRHFEDHHQDTLRGTLVSLDEETITLDTWYAGQLKLKRSLVQSLDVFSQSPSFYSGPNGPDGWVSSSGSIRDDWTFTQGSMTSKTRAGIARKVQIPEQAKISVKVRWKSSPYFRLNFLTKDPKNTYPSEGYSLNVQRSRLTLYRSSKGRRNADIFNTRIENMYEVEEATVTIYYDRTEDGTSAVYLDDKRIDTWSAVDDSQLKGEWLQFVPNRSNPIKISDLSISQWDGILPLSSDEETAENEADPSEPKLKGQEIRLANGDIVIGDIKTIGEDLVHLETGFGNVTVPLRHIRNIIMPKLEDQDIMLTNDVRAWFHEGGYVTIDLKSFDGKTIKGYSQVYGDAEFQVSAFSRIQFNIWEDRLNAARFPVDPDQW